MEVCYGCAAEAELHPVVGIFNINEVAEETDGYIPNPKGPDAKGQDGEHYVGVTVCKKCHEDPENRKRALKCHFFYRTDPDAVLVALIRAGSLNLG